MAECIDSVSFALLFIFLLFNTLCFATPLYFSTDTFHIILLFFFFSFFLFALQEKKFFFKHKKTNHRRSQEESNGSGDYEVSALYVYVLHFLEWN